MGVGYNTGRDGMKDSVGRDQEPMDLGKRTNMKSERTPTEEEKIDRPDRAPGEFPPYTTNDELLKDLLKLVDKIGLLNMAISHKYPQKRPLAIDKKDFSMALKKKRLPGKARKRVALCEKRIQNRMKATMISETGQASFHNFCRHKDFESPKIMIITRRKMRPSIEGAHYNRRLHLFTLSTSFFNLHL